MTHDEGRLVPRWSLGQREGMTRHPRHQVGVGVSRSMMLNAILRGWD